MLLKSHLPTVTKSALQLAEVVDREHRRSEIGMEFAISLSSHLPQIFPISAYPRTICKFVG